MWVEILGALAVLVGVWFAAPSWRGFLRRGWAPVSRDEVSVFWAQQSSHP